MPMDELIYFLGRFHVLILHVPVGVLILAVGMEALSRLPRLFVEGRSTLEPKRSPPEPGRLALEPERSGPEPGRLALEPERSSPEPGRLALEPERSSPESGRLTLEPERSTPEPERSALAPAMPLIWGFGALSGVATVALGSMHASEPGFSGAGVDHHRWAGTLLAFTAVLIWAWRADAPKSFAKIWPVGLAIIVALLIATGHFGGMLTHGPDYLTEYAPGFLHTERAGLTARRKISDPTTADIYLDVVAPLLATRCSSCHSEDKRRGGLSFADYPSLRKGGESGEVIKPGDPAASELYRRITLPATAEDYMPKNHKSPPSTAEIEVLRWWIEIGAPQKARIGELKPPQAVASDLQKVLGASSF
jgi:hypothetical protein